MIFWNKKPDAPRPTTVLTVDDSSTALLVLQRHLEVLGYAVLAAGDGAQGVNIAREHLPDLILMDVAMPVMTGIDALAQLKSDPKTKQIPVIMCSTEQTGRDLEKAFSLGAVGYVIKPISAERLKAQIEKVLPPKA